MTNSQFEAKTFGVGELIAQRKLFQVPPHQRSYAWDKESVEVFLSDIDIAIENGASDYFIGLVVIQSSETGEWVLLDGQQRLTTVSLIYAAIRFLFLNWGLQADAQQVHHEYLGVRRLGGTFSSRMLLNQENQPIFEVVAIDGLAEDVLRKTLGEQCRYGSNKLLLSAAMSCRKWVKDFAEAKGGKGIDDYANRLYEVARFIESRLKVVAVEVSSDVDAYVLFESLNDRGVALSALDLIKNYIFSNSLEQMKNWANLIAILGDENPEDFLKVFWTSRYGLIQKSQIFRQVKAKYPDEESVGRLIREMSIDADILAALSDDDHLLWNSFTSTVRDQVYLLRSLESKQSRPLLISVLREIKDVQLIEYLVKLIATAIVRFQVVGKGRTGVVEKVFGRLCQMISIGMTQSRGDFEKAIVDLMLPDASFAESFMRHEDKRYSRVVYMLSADLAARQTSDPNEITKLTRQYFDSCRVKEIFGPKDLIDKSQASRIGNFQLVSRDDMQAIADPWPTIVEATSPLPEKIIDYRSSMIASKAAQTWAISQGEQ
jgi:hypothetical protein